MKSIIKKIKRKILEWLLSDIDFLELKNGMIKVGTNTVKILPDHIEISNGSDVVTVYFNKIEFNNGSGVVITKEGMKIPVGTDKWVP